jgi:hypothetical protein
MKGLTKREMEGKGKLSIDEELDRLLRKRTEELEAVVLASSRRLRRLIAKATRKQASKAKPTNPR